MLLAGCFSLIFGLACAAVTFLVSGLYFAANGGPDVAAKTGTIKARNQGDSVAVAGAIGFLAVLAILWLVGKNQPDSQPRKIQNTTETSLVGGASTPTEPNRASQPGASPAGDATEPDAKAQAAAQFEKDFYEKYPDLKPGECAAACGLAACVEAVATKLGAQGFTAPTREAVMEAIAKDAWEQIARRQGATRLGWRYETGSGVGQDYAQAAYWYRIAAELNDPIAQNNLRKTVSNGMGCAARFSGGLQMV